MKKKPGFQAQGGGLINIIHLTHTVRVHASTGGGSKALSILTIIRDTMGRREIS